MPYISASHQKQSNKQAGHLTTHSSTLPAAALPYYWYWIGLEKVGYNYYLPDGTYVGNGAVSNANPYAHFSYNFQDRLTGQLGTRDCTGAHSTYKYDLYKGSASDYLAMQRSSSFSSSSTKNK